MERVYPVEKLIFVRDFCGFLCSRAAYAIDDICGDAGEMVSDFNESIGS